TSPTGVSTVAVAITDLDGGPSYFNGTTFTTGGPSFLPAQGSTTSWTYNNASLSFTNDHRYDFIAKVTDVAGNSSSTTYRFVYDITKPTSSVTSPVGGFNTSWSSVSGTASDRVSTPANPAGISASSVQLAIKDLSANWWN